MRTVTIVAALALMVAAPLLAQENGIADSPAYVSASGGFTQVLGQKTGDMLFEAGVRVAPRIKVFGDLGYYHNLQGDLQPTVDAASASLAVNGLNVTGTATVPAWYGLGGVRFDIPTPSGISPYALFGIGAARLNPTPQFAFASGVLPDGTTPTSGMDVTTALTTAGLVTAPVASTGFMTSLGGGVQVPLAKHLGVDVGYRYSRISAGATVASTALNANGMTFGVNYRF